MMTLKQSNLQFCVKLSNLWHIYIYICQNFHYKLQFV